MSDMKSRLLLAAEMPQTPRSQVSSSKSRQQAEFLPSGPQSSPELKQVLLMFKQFMGNSQKIEAALSTHLKRSSYNEMEPRDRPVVIALPEQERVLSKDGLQKYITQLCKEVWSRAFYYYSTNQLSYEHTKIYSSEQILQNLVRLSEKYALEGKHFALINSHIEGKVLDYMLNKYPMTLSQEINRNVNNTIMEVDNSDQLQNDYLYNSNIHFKFRDSGEYNDLIMKTINSVIMRIEHRVGNKTIFEKFQEKMENLFEMVTDEDVMKIKDDTDDLDQYDSLWKISVAFQNQMQKKVNLDDNMKKEGLKKKEMEREKYRSKVKEYTNYKIGRKLPESTRTFSNEEIMSHNIKIESPQVLRLITKWCEELEKKFSTPNYFEHYIETLKLENGKFIILMLNQMKESLDQLMQEEKAKIKTEIEELSLNNYFMQSELLMRQLQNIGYNQIERYERISAKYSIDIVNNLHSYIITYLNRLIHGLLTVAIKFSKLPSVSHIEWPSNINLITFQVMDLLRCKCSSGEKEILKILKELNTMCGENENLKLVRVVNRLKRGTHDVLINVRYRDVLCEIQLAVTSKNNKFIEFSNTFNHYLYELKRSVFGPLTELCSIWKSLDLKFNVYAEIDCEKCKEFPCKRPHQCSQRNEYEQYSKPFICSECHVHNFHNNFIKQHLKCKHCSYWICARCQIQISDCKSMLSAAYKNEDIVRKCSRIRNKVNEIPDYGICIHIESPEIRVEPFRRYSHKNIIKIIGIKNKMLYEIDDISTHHREMAFRERFLIFELTDDFGSRYIKIDDEKVKDFLLEQRILTSYSRNKEKICLNNRGLTDTLFEKFATLGTKQQRDNIKKIEIVSNRLENVKNIADNFNNLTTLQMSKNSVSNFTGIQKLDRLQKLFISENNLQQVPREIGELNNLKELALCDNHITQIPDFTGKLLKLRQLKMSGNKIQLIPESLAEIKNLNELYLKNNLIKRIPSSIGNFFNLEILQIQNNYISFVHENIGQLTKLQSINLSYNQISSLPASFSSLKGLTRCNLRHNGLKQAPQFNSMKALVTVDLSNNQISKQISIKSLPKLLSLNVNYNLLEQLPQISDCPSLRCLSAAHNAIKKLPDLQNICTLEQLYLNNNQLVLLPDNMQKLQRLEMLHLEHNNLTAIEDLKLQKLKKLNISHNKLKSFSNMDFRVMEELDVGFNQIAIFSWNLLPLVRKLNINNNKIEHLDVSGYPKLKCIFASGNKLQLLPQVSDKNSIKTLILEHNLIKTLPPNLIKFRQLQQMNLGHNHIKIIPRQIEQMVNLMDKSLQLNHNPVQSIESWQFVIRKITRSTIQQLELFKNISDLQNSQLEVRSQESVDLSPKQPLGKASSVF